MSNIEKLPMWAQKHIEKLQQERDVAVRELRVYVDTQTPAPFKFTEMECIGEQQGPSFLDRYVTARNCEITHAGIVLNVGLRDDVIQLSWTTADNRLIGFVNMRPTSFQQVALSL